MPELPEVETTRRGIAPQLLHKTVSAVIVRQPQLRWPVTPALTRELPGQTIVAVERRGKYLIIHTGQHYLLVHLGMSGSLRLVSADTATGKHDHVDVLLKDGLILRYTDPRRFGCILWVPGDPLAHPLLSTLGPEPLSMAFTLEYLCQQAKGRKTPIKTFIMDSHVVVGVGNIYANEALFRAGINPRRVAGRVSTARLASLISHIQQILEQAIAMGGTTLRDFVGGTGKPGYFKQSLAVYGRGGQPCVNCSTPLKEIRLGQRSTVFCTTCQK